MLAICDVIICVMSGVDKVPAVLATCDDDVGEISVAVQTINCKLVVVLKSIVVAKSLLSILVSLIL